MRKLIPASGLLFLTITVYADLAPVIDTGHNVVGKPVNDIELTEAFVDIYWGNPCFLKGSFVLNNTSPEDIATDIGFPVIEEHFAESFRYSVKVNGTVLRSTNELFESPYYIWHVSKCVLKPGRSVVDVTCNLYPSQIRTSGHSMDAGRFKIIRYVMRTGGLWKGSVKKEVVNVWFPDEVTKGSVHDRTGPKCYKIEGNRITWVFQDTDFTYKDDITVVVDMASFSDPRNVKEHNNPVQETPAKAADPDL